MKIDVNEFLKPCSCGRKHEIVVDDIIIESGAISQLPDILKRPAYADKKSLVMICDENTYEAAGKQVDQLYRQSIFLVNLCVELWPNAVLLQYGAPRVSADVRSGRVHAKAAPESTDKESSFGPCWGHCRPAADRWDPPASR